MIATFRSDKGIIMRPVQVKGKYAQDGKLNSPRYGYIGKLTAMHPHMVLAVPYFSSGSGNFPDHIAWVPYALLKPHSRGYRADYANFSNGQANPRPGFAHLFNEAGLKALAELNEG